ncbi:NnrS family protein [Nitratireductor aquimarinus]|uniref:NnrS family protein n=1 Tax=Nitratireductor aquimarinus TaxID=889300 RepID=UPI002936695C|nr:NnrS family protein [Nitratireductor aquimarinus]MDV2967109.1 NnrS family protein [Nitratireductor aquimarinus]
MAVPRLRAYEGPAVLSYGFRPFFLLGAAYSGLSILAWLPIYMGLLETRSLFLPVDWHVHEMLFGFLAAVVAGFLLTAIPNWTGRLPVQGTPLAVLVALWIAGRVAIYYSASLGWWQAAIIDNAFLVALTLAAVREIVAGRNWRNLKVLMPLAVLLLANILFHVEVQTAGISDVSRRLGLCAAIVLIMIIGGRIIPSFTRNWLVRENPGRLPVPFGQYDVASLVVSTAALTLWVFLPEALLTGVLLAIAAVSQAVRLTRWAGERTVRDALVLMLHIAYAFVPFGLGLLALSALLPESVPQAAGFHALGGGAIGAMTLAVMMRATLGHTGRMLKAGLAGGVIFGAVCVAAIVRVWAAFEPGLAWVHISGTAWMIAFLGFALLYSPALLRARRSS